MARRYDNSYTDQLRADTDYDEWTRQADAEHEQIQNYCEKLTNGRKDKWRTADRKHVL